MWLRKLIVPKESNKCFDEARRIKSRMYLPESIRAGAARFGFDADRHLDISLITAGRLAVAWL
jgi:hypothetical protein